MNRSVLPLALLVVGAGQASSQQRALSPEPGERHLRNIRQLTFGGNNAEAYFNGSSSSARNGSTPAATSSTP